MSAGAGTMAAKAAVRKENRLLWWGLFAVFMLLSAAGMLKTVWLSADIDESYALTMAVRMARGDRLLLEMWEPHQFSALLYMPFVWLYLLFAGETAEGIVVFLRLLGFFVQALLSVAVYRRVRKTGRLAALFAAFAYLNFTPKLIQSPEFTTLFYWAMTALLLLLLRLFDVAGPYAARRRRAAVIAAGLCMSVMVLCYPGTVLVFCYVLLLLWRGIGGRAEKETTVRPGGDALLFFVTCAAAGVLFLLVLVFGGDVKGALSDLPHVLSDASHTQSLILLWREHLVSAVLMLAGTAGILVLVLCGRPVWDKNRQKTCGVFSAVLVLQAVWMVIQFHDWRGKAYYDYLPIAAQLALVCQVYLFEKKDRRTLLVSCGVPLLSTVCILGMSNLPASYSMGFLLPAVFLVLPQLFAELTGDGKKRFAFVAFCFALVLLCQLFMVRLCMVRFSGNQRRDVFEPYYKVNHGPLAGIRLGAEDWKHHDGLLHLYVEQIRADDVVLYVGADYFMYSLLAHGQLGTGNTISTPGFGEQLLAYYERFPERIPTVVFVEQMYVHDYREALTKEPFATFFETYFDSADVAESGSVLIYRRKKG